MEIEVAKLVIPAKDLPLRIVNDICVAYGFELDVDAKEIIVLEVEYAKH